MNKTLPKYGTSSSLDQLDHVSSPVQDDKSCRDKFLAALCCACACSCSCLSGLMTRFGYSTITKTVFVDEFAEHIKHINSLQSKEKEDLNISRSSI